jgi:hypothetical protein
MKAAGETEPRRGSVQRTSASTLWSSRSELLRTIGWNARLSSSFLIARLMSCASWVRRGSYCARTARPARITVGSISR